MAVVGQQHGGRRKMGTPFWAGKSGRLLKRNLAFPWRNVALWEPRSPDFIKGGYMRSLSTLSVLLVLALLGGCGPAADAEAGDSAGAESAAAETSGMSATEAAQDVSCWLGGGTMEEALQRPSPPGETEFVLDGHVGKVCYSRPSARERVVEGGLIPFDAPWRLGANEATVIHLPFPAIVGGIELEAGSYSLYVNAGEFEWEFVLNSTAERWGIPIDDDVKTADFATFTGMPRTMTEPVEQFTIDWHTHGGENGHLGLEWGTTRVEIEVRTMDHVQ